MRTSFILCCILIGCAARPGTALRSHAEAEEDGTVGSTERSQELQVLSARAGTELLAATDSFLAMQVSSSEKARVRRMHKVAALEKHGMSLEEQFQLYVLQQSAVRGFLESTPGAPKLPLRRRASLFQQSQEPPGTHVAALKNKVRKVIANAVNMEPEPENYTVEHCLTPGNTSSGVGCTEQPAFVARQFLTFQREIRHTVRTITLVKGFMNESNLSPKTVNMQEIKKDIATYLAVDHLINEKLDGDFDEALSTANPEAYRRWKKRQASKTSAWFSKLLQKLGMGITPADPGSLKALYEDMLTLSDRLATMDASVLAADKVSWTEVEAKSSFFVRMWKNTKKWFVATGANFAAAAASIWASFMAKNEEAEVKCSRELEGEVRSSANTQGVLSGDELMKKVTKGNQEQLVNDQIEKSERTLSETRATTGGSADALKNHTEILKNTYYKLKDNAKNGTLDINEVVASEKAMVEVQTGACQEKKGDLGGIASKVLQGLKSMWRGIKKVGKAIGHGIKLLIPTIGTRGLGGTVGPAGGGFEEVIDFRNREIGYFAWGAAQVGTSLASASFGGYIGFAVHGYKADWSLEESYITAVYTAYSPGVNWFGLEASVGITFCLDADNSQGTFTPWVPEPQGINGVVVGWSIGAGASLPIDIGVDVGQALYHMFTSECFSTSWRFLGGILNKLCMSCSGTEALMMTALRAGTWLAGFPVVSDAIFFVMWAINEIMRLWESDRPPNPVCSPRSTTNRDNPRYMARIIAQKVEESHVAIRRIQSNAAALVHILKEALTEHQYEVHNSAEVAMVHTLAVSECLREPSFLDLAKPRTARPLPLLPKSEIKEIVAEMSMDELKQKCEEYNISSCDGYMFEDNLRKDVRVAISHVSSANPFGKCDTDRECFDASPNTECVYDTNSAYLGMRRGDCRCKPGYCYEANKNGQSGCFQHMDIALEQQLEEGIDVWLHQRQIELGSFAEQLKTLIP